MGSEKAGDSEKKVSADALSTSATRARENVAGDDARELTPAEFTEAFITPRLDRWARKYGYVKVDTKLVEAVRTAQARIAKCECESCCEDAREARRELTDSILAALEPVPAPPRDHSRTTTIGDVTLVEAPGDFCGNTGTMSNGQPCPGCRACR